MTGFLFQNALLLSLQKNVNLALVERMTLHNFYSLVERTRNFNVEKQAGEHETTITNYSTIATFRDNRTSLGSRSIRVGNPGLHETVPRDKKIDSAG